MSIYTSTFALLTDAQATAVRPTRDSSPIGNDKQGVRLRIKDLFLERTAGTGTQFLVRFYMGWTADKTHQPITTVLIPAVAGDWDNAGGGEANSTPDPAKSFNLLEKDFPEGWASSAPRAGLGLWWDVTQAAGSSATNAVALKVDVGH